MFDRLIRYLSVLDYIEKYKPLRILEVGSSSRGIGEFYDGKFTGVDMNFPETPVKNMKAVLGSAEKLPFPDASFDLTFSIDTFEHLNEKIRGKALEEMLRVCKGTVIIGFPCGVGAEKLSKKMLEWFEERGSGTAQWMREHVSFGLPNEKFPNSNFKFPNNLTIKQFNNENLFVCEMLLKLEENGRFLKIERYLLKCFEPMVKFILRRLNFGKCYRKIYLISSTI
jgi:hypothetical protein